MHTGEHMTERVTAHTIFAQQQHRLLLRWHYGQSQDAKALHPASEKFSAFAGFF